MFLKPVYRLKTSLTSADFRMLSCQVMLYGVKLEDCNQDKTED